MSLKKDKTQTHRRIEIAMWANEHALVSGVVLLIGGIVGLFNFSGWQFAGYAAVIGSFIFLYEYPRGLREDGVSMRRRGQDNLEPFVSLISLICCNYGVRAAIYFVLSLPCAGCLPASMGGISLLIASFLYFIAALRNETRKAPEVKKRSYQWKRKSTIKQPTHPPPRLKHYADSKIVKPCIILTIPSDTEYDGSQTGSTENVNSLTNNSENCNETNLFENGSFANHGFSMEVNDKPRGELASPCQSVLNRL